MSKKFSRILFWCLWESVFDRTTTLFMHFLNSLFWVAFLKQIVNPLQVDTFFDNIWQYLTNYTIKVQVLNEWIFFSLSDRTTIVVLSFWFKSFWAAFSKQNLNCLYAMYIEVIIEIVLIVNHSGRQKTL